MAESLRHFSCKPLRILLAAACFFSSVSTLASIGDDAPPIPATYIVGHPRLGAPDNAFLDILWSRRSDGAARYWLASNSWDSSAPGSLIDFRRLLIAYLAENRNHGPHTASYLKKIREMATPVGSWALGNCGGWTSGIGLALAYDWVYADLDPSTRAAMRSTLYTIMEEFEANFSGSSPYNDQFYITGCRQVIDLIPALAIYPDDAANSLPHLRWAMAVWFHRLLPAWKQVMGGEACGASSDSAVDCGGGWHESWEYVNQMEGLRSWFVPSLRAWQSASGDNIFVREPWIKNFAYWTMYQVRPDFITEPIGAVARPYFTNEYDGPAAYLGSLDGLAAIYDDPTLRGWSRLVNWNNTAPDGFEPACWPYCAPDNARRPVHARSALSTTRNFPGWGTIFFRSGWGESNTFCTLRYGDNFWSHPVEDTGAFTCFNRGPLAIRSGTYRAGSASQHFALYTLQAIAQNVVTITDPKDFYPDETYALDSKSGEMGSSAMPNDGGQRRVGSSLGNFGALADWQRSPDSRAQWQRSREYYHQGQLVAYKVDIKAGYSYAAIDETAAYNNRYSHNPHHSRWNPAEANTSNRTYRVGSAVRQFVFIPRGTAAYVVVYDHIIGSDSSFRKKWLLHSINKPVINDTEYAITRDELVASLPFPDLWPYKWRTHLRFATDDAHYKYAGRLYGWMTLPSRGSIALIGGPAHEFDIAGSNYNECSKGQCTTGEVGSYNEGLGRIPDVISPELKVAPQQPGSWRIEESPESGNKEDWFLNIMLVTNTRDPDLVSLAPTTVELNGHFLTSWKDNSNRCTYTLGLAKQRLGVKVSFVGSGCIGHAPYSTLPPGSKSTVMPLP